jgi:hypothetical protein
MTKTSDPRRVNRYRELSQLLDEAAEKLERICVALNQEC